MQNIICLLSLIPVRKDPDHRSEQVSQLLFGERAQVISQNGEWIQITTQYDSYTGWVELKAVEELADNSDHRDRIIMRDPLCVVKTSGKSMMVPAGSEIPNPEGSVFFHLAGNVYRLDNPVQSTVAPSHIAIVETALTFLSAPYLWGGRTILGMDCSGLVQLVYKINGINLPRDSKDLLTQGSEIASFWEVQHGDIAFFGEEKSKITHVGIVGEDGQIIHAAQYVKTDRLDEKGIFNAKIGAYTHKLQLIRRIII